MSQSADGPPLGEPPRPAVEVKTPRIYERIVQFRSNYLAGQEIPSVAALISEIEERQRVLGEAADQATKAVVEELERAAAAINVRTAPLVPTCGLVVAGAGLLEKFITPTPPPGIAAVAIVLAMVGLYFSVVGMFTHAGRRRVGLIPTQEDVAFVRARLIKKEANAQIGSVLLPLGLIVLVVLILSSFQLEINITL